ncbi:sigma-54-dependent Fis family transcriptional regulator [Bacillus sp. FJAT-44742]|uniref:sigma-54-dependent Fis family transcriptional regulator n=1 Tax=Bacillus sp. FJAT-44742 TaxID=2014005 RepID=UPI000C23CBA1|nr:sigma-54-dependent Fis family transcriptional regulator [Bacillus sp. FJAT-44742]
MPMTRGNSEKLILKHGVIRMEAEQVTKKVWDRFVKEGALDESRINKRILESWYMCKKSGVNPFNGRGTKVLADKELELRKRENSLLLEIASPFIENLQKMFRKTNSNLLLIDKDGYVLKVAGNKQSKQKASEINFIEGVQWTENLVGTNAIGTTLRTDEPITIIGAEHFSIASQNWACSAAPIHDEEGKLIGVLDVSSPLTSCQHEHMLGGVVATAYAIEHQWQKKMKEEEIELLHYALDCKDESKPYILFNRRNKIIYTSPFLRDKISIHSLTISSLQEEGYTLSRKDPIVASTNTYEIGYYAEVSKIHKKKPLNQRKSERSSFRFEGIQGESQVFKDVLDQIKKAAPTDIPVHIYGETGTGKELAARTLHENSERSDGPFVPINCGALPEDLLESELFGYGAGAFTGAKRNGYEGKLLQANKGTLFLDEIGEIPLKMQIALLRVLQEKRVTPLASKESYPIDIRLISATNENIHDLIEKGRFRSDLYYRIFVYSLSLPSLQERKEDIPAFISSFCKEHSWNVQWNEEHLEIFQSHDWPGNIRELHNTLERIRIHFKSQVPSPLELSSLIREERPLLLPQKKNEKKEEKTLSFRETVEVERIKTALATAGGNVSKASSLAGIPRSTFYRKIKKYKL